jgi:Domain of unknown function (DUF1996)
MTSVMTNRRTLATATLALVTVALLGLAGKPASAAVPREGDVRFKVTCDFDHHANDDPIVNPGQPGAAHLHDFFGKRNVDSTTTSYSKLADGDDKTSCNDAKDLAAYWVPAVSTSAGVVTPVRMTAYYRRGSKTGTIKPFPAGLKVIAGWQSGKPQPAPDISGWKCSGTEKPQTTPPTSCPTGEWLNMFVRFPDCWDGRNLDSADHRSHMAYSAFSTSARASTCPTSHPVPVPSVSYYINFSSLPDGRSVTGIASGGVETVHGDFFNGWDVARLQERVDTCLNGYQRCASGGDGAPLTASEPFLPATEPALATSDESDRVASATTSEPATQEEPLTVTPVSSTVDPAHVMTVSCSLPSVDPAATVTAIEPTAPEPAAVDVRERPERRRR